MKYGVIVYEETNNIGDDIQSYAAAQLLPHIDYYIEREHLDVFRPKEDEPVNAIINGWLMYNKLGWPVSPCINPLYISMHFWEKDALTIEDKFLDGMGGEDLRKFQPIGCRDQETELFLRKAGIETWFSGCVTLTLQAKFPKSEEKYICLTDVSEEVEQFVRRRYPGTEIRIIHHEDDKCVVHSGDWNKRFGNVEKLLKEYQNATAVITTRLHCAMPCLALETPVLLLSEDDIAENGRFEGLESLVIHGSEFDFLNGNIEYDLENPPKNPLEYIKVRKTLIERVEKFIENNKVCTPYLKERFETYDKEWEKRALWKDQKITELMHLAIAKWKTDHDSMEELQKGKEWLEKQYFTLQKENSKLNETCSKLNETCSKLEEENSQLNARNFEIENTNAELGISNSILQNRNADLKKDIECAKKQNDIYYDNIVELKNSLSWKIGWGVTALPRKIYGLLKKK